MVILLYCATSVTPGFLAKDAFDFAFPHAINLATSAKKTEEKRIGRPENGSFEFLIRSSMFRRVSFLFGDYAYRTRTSADAY